MTVEELVEKLHNFPASSRVLVEYLEEGEDQPTWARIWHLFEEGKMEDDGITVIISTAECPPTKGR